MSVKHIQSRDHKHQVGTMCTQNSSVTHYLSHSADMDANTSVDEFLQSFIQEINALNALEDNATNIPMEPTNLLTEPTNEKKRKRASAKPMIEKPGWVPKPTDDSPIVSWMEDGKLFAVQNPTNKGPLLLKMELYDGIDMVNRCGLYLDKDSEMHQNVKYLFDKLENMWIDKRSGVPKIDGLSQTVTQYITTSSTPKPRKRVLNKKPRSK